MQEGTPLLGEHNAVLNLQKLTARDKGAGPGGKCTGFGFVCLFVVVLGFCFVFCFLIPKRFWGIEGNIESIGVPERTRCHENFEKLDATHQQYRFWFVVSRGPWCA